MGRRCIQSRAVRDIGAVLLNLREMIVSGEVRPPWPVVPHPVSNEIAALLAADGRFNRGLSGADQEALSLWKREHKYWRIQIMGVKGKRPAGKFGAEILVVVIPPEGGGKTFRATMDAAEFNQSNLAGMLDQAKETILEEIITDGGKHGPR